MCVGNSNYCLANILIFQLKANILFWLYLEKKKSIPVDSDKFLA